MTAPSAHRSPWRPGSAWDAMWSGSSLPSPSPPRRRWTAILCPSARCLGRCLAALAGAEPLAEARIWLHGDVPGAFAVLLPGPDGDGEVARRALRRRDGLARGAGARAWSGGAEGFVPGLAPEGAPFAAPGADLVLEGSAPGTLRVGERREISVPDAALALPLCRGSEVAAGRARFARVDPRLARFVARRLGLQGVPRAAVLGGDWWFALDTPGAATGLASLPGVTLLEGSGASPTVLVEAGWRPALPTPVLASLLPAGVVAVLATGAVERLPGPLPEPVPVPIWAPAGPAIAPSRRRGEDPGTAPPSLALPLRLVPAGRDLPPNGVLMDRREAALLGRLLARFPSDWVDEAAVVLAEDAVLLASPRPLPEVYSVGLPLVGPSPTGLWREAGWVVSPILSPSSLDRALRRAPGAVTVLTALRGRLDLPGRAWPASALLDPLTVLGAPDLAAAALPPPPLAAALSDAPVPCAGDSDGTDDASAALVSGRWLDAARIRERAGDLAGAARIYEAAARRGLDTVGGPA